MRQARVVALFVFTAFTADSTVSAELLSETKLRPSDAFPTNHFGESVSIDAGTVVVGAPGAFASGVRSGAAYVFERNLGGDENWGEAKKLTASDAAELDEFGWSVAVSGDTLVVAASADSVYVYAPRVDEDAPPLRLPTMPISGLCLLGATLLLAGTSRLWA